MTKKEKLPTGPKIGDDVDGKIQFEESNVDKKTIQKIANQIKEARNKIEANSSAGKHEYWKGEIINYG